MIRVFLQGIAVNKGLTISHNKVFVSITGHSGQAAKGNDIVCAGVSALSQSVALTLQYYEIVDTIIQKDGLLEFYIDMSLLDDVHKRWCESILAVLIVGIGQLHKMYPDYIDVIFDEQCK